LPPGTSCHILRLKCTNFDFGWGSAPDPAGELTALPRPPAGFQVLTYKEREWKGGVENGRGSENWQGREDREERRRKGRGEDWGREVPHFARPLLISFRRLRN